MNAVLTNRVFGLDILRTVAIIIVVISHSSINLIEEHGLVYLPDGVDLFFVLSGYLIGKILITTAQQTGGFNISATLNFIQRRWFRTLPNYFLFLIINIILIYFGSIQGTLNKYLVTFFVFFQNFSKPYDFLFWESWSLSIEEWFYLSFPLLLMLMFQITKFKRKVKLVFIFSILVFLICPLLYRIGFTNKSLDYDLYCRKLVLTRLDTIGFGLLGAYFKTYYSSTWLKYKNQAFFAGLVLLFLLLSSSSTNHFFKWTFYYTIMGAGILFLLPKLESLTIEKIPLKICVFRKVFNTKTF